MVPLSYFLFKQALLSDRAMMMMAIDSVHLTAFEHAYQWPTLQLLPKGTAGKRQEREVLPNLNY